MDVATAAAAAANAISNASLTPEEKARYEAARKELIQALQKKRLVDRQLATLELQIYNFEGSYLSETAQHSGGNIIQGFDGYLKTQSVGRRRHEPTDADRVFSNSSLSYQKSLDLLSEGAADDPDNFGPVSAVLNPSSTLSSNSRGPTPGLTSIVLPPPTSATPLPGPKSEGGGSGQSSSQPLTAAQQKKMRDKEYQRRKRATAAREKERNAMIAAAAAAQAQAAAAQAQAQAANGTPMDGVEEENGAGASVSAVSTARGRLSKKPRPADDN